MSRSRLKFLCRALVCQACLIPAITSVGCQNDSLDPANNGSQPREQYQIVCTTSMVADIARNVAGDRAKVVTIMGAVDPHTYEPTTKDIQKIQDADVVLYSGLLLEGPMQPALEKVAKTGKVVLAVTSELESSSGDIRYSAEFGNHPDPHVWHDPILWAKCAESVAKRLSEYDPQGKSVYEENSARYSAQLQELDTYARQAIASIPEPQRYLVTAHDAFGYFARRYEIPVKSVQGITTESEAGLADINQLVNFLVTYKIPAVFVEETVNRANLDAVIQSCSKRGWSVTVGGSLYSDSMGPAGTYEGTYIGMIEYNVNTIVRALGGTIPEREFRLTLNSSDIR